MASSCYRGNGWMLNSDWLESHRLLTAINLVQVCRMEPVRRQHYGIARDFLQRQRRVFVSYRRGEAREPRYNYLTLCPHSTFRCIPRPHGIPAEDFQTMLASALRFRCARSLDTPGYFESRWTSASSDVRWPGSAFFGIGCGTPHLPHGHCKPGGTFSRRSEPRHRTLG